MIRPTTEQRLFRVLSAGAVVAAAVALGGCGIKSSPTHPGDSDYPRQYPAKEKTQVNSDKQAPAPTSPGGFPYEYPNRPPTR